MSLTPPLHRRIVPPPPRPAPVRRGRGQTSPCAFFSRVYALVRAVPRGRVVTYGQLAAILGVPRGARAVGWALRALSPEEAESVPWQRVVGRGGVLKPHAGGIQRQARRLRDEGVILRGSRVDMTRYGLS